jgi:hypothetical protein
MYLRKHLTNIPRTDCPLEYVLVGVVTRGPLNLSSPQNWGKGRYRRPLSWSSLQDYARFYVTSSIETARKTKDFVKCNYSFNILQIWAYLESAGPTMHYVHIEKYILYCILNFMFPNKAWFHKLN